MLIKLKLTNSKIVYLIRYGVYNIQNSRELVLFYNHFTNISWQLISIIEEYVTRLAVMINFHVEDIHRMFCASLSLVGFSRTILRRTLMYRRDEGGNNGRSSRSYWQEGCRKTGRHCSSRTASVVSADIKHFCAREKG